MNRTRAADLCWILLITALVQRALNLRAFLTLDETRWILRSRTFLLALQNHDWARTMVIGHPGVTTMWTGTLGLLTYGWTHNLISPGSFGGFLSTLDWVDVPIDLLPYVRFPTAFICSVAIAAVYPLVKRLYGHRAALIATLLLIFNPVYLAQSRILHHDALMATFMLLSALNLLNYLQTGAFWYLVLSGGLAGLAGLSKTLSIVLAMWASLICLIYPRRQSHRFQQGVSDGVTWAMSAALVFYIALPAMWLQPLTTLRRMVQMLVSYGGAAHEEGQFFLGQAIADPGPFYYVVVLAFALTPVALGGLVLALCCGRKRNFKALERRFALACSRSLLLLALVYVLAITLGDKKQARYLLPVLLVFDILAAHGWAKGVAWLEMRLSILHAHSVRAGARLFILPVVRLVVIVLIGSQAFTSLSHYPYYVTYANPILGGTQAAARTLLLGSGEGSELAAEWLNARENAADLTVVHTESTTFGSFFAGTTLPGWPPTQLFRADYVVLYHRNLQLQSLPAELTEHIQESWPLVHTIVVRDVPYAQIYEAPAAQWVAPVGRGDNTAVEYGLLAMRLEAIPEVKDSLRVTVYRHVLNIDGADWHLGVKTSDSQISRLVQSEHVESLPRRPGTIVEEVFQVDIPDSLYSTNITFYAQISTDETWSQLPTMSHLKP